MNLRPAEARAELGHVERSKVRAAFGVRGFSGPIVAALCTLGAVSSAQARPLTVDSLVQSAALPLLPESPPSSIPSSEKLTSLFKTQPMERSSDADYFGLSLIPGDSKEMDHFALSATEGEAPVTSPVCFYTAHPTSQGSPQLLNGWEMNGERMTYVTTYAGYRRIGAVRTERIVDGPDKTWLEVTDFWLDVRTGGVRQFGNSRLDLTEIARPSDGVILYASKTSPTQVEVLVRLVEGRVQKELEKELGAEVAALLAESGVPDGQIVIDSTTPSRSNCGHQRVRLDIAAEAPPEAAPAPKRGKLHKHARAKSVVRLEEPLGAEAPAKPPNSARVQLRLLTTWENAAKEPATRYGTLSAVEVRPLQINLGLSRMSSDRSPVLSLSYRWTSPASRLQVTSSAEEESIATLVDVDL